MPIHKIAHDQVVYNMSKDNAPVISIDSEDEVLFETCDCFSDQIKRVDIPFNDLDWQRINPATGPVYVNGAKSGDILRVDIKKISLIRDFAVMATVPNQGVIGDQLNQPELAIIPIKENKALLPGGVAIPIRPMIGVIGVAPAGKAISCGTPDSHGGNMDCKEIIEGTTLYLPINVDGALFALGDLHAAMGDGEVSVCGLEIAGEVLVKLTAIKNKSLPLPLLENQDFIYTIASALTLDEAAKIATNMMVTFLISKTQLSKANAINILSIAGDLQICQVVDPLKTCRFALPKNILRQLSINFGN